MSDQSDIQRITATALAEDGETDLTTELTVTPQITAEGIIESRDGGVLSGTAYADAVAQVCGCTVHWKVSEGASVPAGAAVGMVRGRLPGMLRAERPLLNLLQRATGIATATRALVTALEGTGCRVLHTRKTAPGLRALDVAAVVAGGGQVHRKDLGHEVMIKDNHWQALTRQGGRLETVLAEARMRGVTALYVEVENLDQLEVACTAGATRLLVDNQTPDTLRRWSAIARARLPGIEIEATGGITAATARAYAEAGADFISIGALTHSVRAADLALEVKF